MPSETRLYAELEAAIADISPRRVRGSISKADSNSVEIVGLSGFAKIGDLVRFIRPTEEPDADPLYGEIVGLDANSCVAMVYGDIEGVSANRPVELAPPVEIRPSDAWLGRIMDGFGRPWSGQAPARGEQVVTLRGTPPSPVERRGLGARLSTGVTALDTVLPICRGQRVGLFAGSGVGKSTLIATLANSLEADVAVIGLIGERGREVRDFAERVMGDGASSRSVIIAATSDQPAPLRRRAAYLTMAVAEYFRDQGKGVLCVMDSVTRVAEAHREIALAAGETPALRAYPPSTGNMIARLAERAGPGADGQGDITAVLSVLVAGSDMDEPVADMTRGILDGHIVLTREIAERGRFPAIDLAKSVSRSLPDAATSEENDLIGLARRVVSVYEDAKPMLQAGLYNSGSDPEIDAAITLYPHVDAFLGSPAAGGVDASFDALRAILGGGEDQPQSEQ
ncbi:MAG: FliI/YscN family ATPase [Pseudomonadota bacterium]